MDILDYVRPFVSSCAIRNALLVVITLLILYNVFYKWLKRPPNFPPGSNGWPILGDALKMFDRPEIQLMNLSNKYGPVMGLKVLNSHVLVLSDMESVHQALVKQGPVFAGRQKGGIFDVFCGGRGLAGIDGTKWKENRKFASFVLRQLGTGKKIMEEKIVEEMISMCSALQAIQDIPFDPSNMVTHSSANIICGIAFGERYDYSDLEFINVARTLVDWFSDNANAFLVLTMLPQLRDIYPFTKSSSSLQKSIDTLYTLLIPIIVDHKKKLDNYEFRDFVEAYLQEIEKSKDDPDSVFTDEELKGVVRDFFVAGTDTTATTIRWTLIFLLNRPDVQKKIQKEIDKVIGPDAFPKMSHLDDMHYTKAVMHEMLRHRTPGPLGLIHRTLEDTKFMGYDIPKDTQLIVNIWAIHRDPKFWDKPDEFRPERFLDKDGKFQKRSNYLPFSIGTRYCMGESLVKMEFFFFLVVVLQRFHLLMESDNSPPISEKAVKSGQFLIAPRFKMRVKERFCRMKSILEYRKSMWE